jgi:hypothetical protein
MPARPPKVPFLGWEKVCFHFFIMFLGEKKMCLWTRPHWMSRSTFFGGGAVSIFCQCIPGHHPPLFYLSPFFVLLCPAILGFSFRVLCKKDLFA